MSLAIVWPANPKNLSDKREADPELICELLKKQKVVYWDSMPKRKDLSGPLNGYIYINGLVRYHCVVDEVLNRDRLLKRQHEHMFIPEFRRQCLFGMYSDGTYHSYSNTWIRISKIHPINPPLSLASFRKWNGQVLRRVQGGIVYLQPS